MSCKVNPLWISCCQTRWVTIWVSTCHRQGCGMNSTALLESTDSGTGFTRKTYRGQGESTGEKAGVPLHEQRHLWMSSCWLTVRVFLFSPEPPPATWLPLSSSAEEWKQLDGETNRILDGELSGFGATLSAVLAAWHLETLLFTPHGGP